MLRSVAGLVARAGVSDRHFRAVRAGLGAGDRVGGGLGGVLRSVAGGEGGRRRRWWRWRRRRWRRWRWRWWRRLDRAGGVNRHRAPVPARLGAGDRVGGGLGGVLRSVAGGEGGRRRRRWRRWRWRWRWWRRLDRAGGVNRHRAPVPARLGAGDRVGRGLGGVVRSVAGGEGGRRWRWRRRRRLDRAGGVNRHRAPVPARLGAGDRVGRGLGRVVRSVAGGEGGRRRRRRRRWRWRWRRRRWWDAGRSRVCQAIQQQGRRWAGRRSSGGAHNVRLEIAAECREGQLAALAHFAGGGGDNRGGRGVRGLGGRQCVAGGRVNVVQRSFCHPGVPLGGRSVWIIPRRVAVAGILDLRIVDL